MAYEIPDLSTLLDLEAVGDDRYRGLSPTYPWGGLYGGQVVAQALTAAEASLVADHRIHSLHSYFVHPGDVDQPVDFAVRRVRDGRSFSTRAVSAIQDGRPILEFTASFQAPEEGAESSLVAPPEHAPPPDTVEESSWSPLMERRLVNWGAGDGPTLAWMRVPGASEIERGARAEAALAFCSDDLPTAAAGRTHPADTPAEDEWDETFFSVSLDHSIWFHRTFDAERWLLFEHTGRGVAHGRGLSTGNVFSDDGQHVATIAQEVLLRERRR